MGGAQCQPPPHGCEALHHPVVGELVLDFESLELPEIPAR